MSKKKTGLVIAIIIYKVILTLVYKELEIELFGYVNYPNNFSYERFICSNICFIIMLMFLPKNINKVSAILNLMIFLLTVLPFTVVFEFSDYDYSYLILTVICFVIQSFIIRLATGRKKEKQAKPLVKFNNSSVKMANMAIGILTVGTLLVTYGLPSLSNLNFYNISDVRASYSDNSIITVLILPLFARVINMLNIYHSIKERSLIKCIFFIVVQIYIYLITGFKTYLFLPVLITVLMFVEKKNIALMLTYAMSFMIIASWVAYALLSEPMIPALFVNRLLFLPAKIKFCYFDFFQNNPYLMFSQSTIGSILNISSPYSSPIPNIIGEKYFNSFEMYCNTGYMTSGYADFGVFGMLVMTVVVSAVFAFLDKIKGDKALILGVFLNYAISLNDGAIITILFSGGLLFTILYFYVIDTSCVGLKRKKSIYKCKKGKHCYGTKN